MKAGRHEYAFEIRDRREYRRFRMSMIPLAVVVLAVLGVGAHWSQARVDRCHDSGGAWVGSSCVDRSVVIHP